VGVNFTTRGILSAKVDKREVGMGVNVGDIECCGNYSFKFRGGSRGFPM
jgi:hypothetical protein